MNYRIKLFLKNSFLILYFLSGLVVANTIEEKDYSPYPQPDSGYVTDYANLLTKEEEERIEKWLWQVEYRSKVEIIVFTIKSVKDYPGTSKDSVDSFATGLFDAYRIGNMPQNDGVLLLISSEDRRARIELGASYGRSRDGDALKIMDSIIVPQFKKGDYVAGITLGTEALIEEFANMRIGFPWHIVWIALGSLGSLLVGISLLKNGKRGWGYVFIGLAIVLILVVIYLTVKFVQQLPKGDSDSWGSGGMGGFGGGFSGGGGASGSW